MRGFGAGGEGGEGGQGGAGAASGLWTREPWAAFCPVERADPPGAVTAALTWQPCRGESNGCEALDDPWLGPAGGGEWSTPIFSGPSGAQYSGLHVRLPDGANFAATFAPSGAPTNVWRGTIACELYTPVVDVEGFWFGVENFVDESWYVRGIWTGQGETRVPLRPLPLHLGYTTDQRGGTNSLLFLQRDNGGLAIWDDELGALSDFIPVSTVVAQFSPPGSPSLGVVHGVDADRAEGWIWDRTSATFSLVVVPPEGRTVAALHESPGLNALFWVTDDAANPGISPELWRSPTVMDAAQLQPQLVVALLGFQTGDRVGGGFYATPIPSTNQVQLVRLADGATATVTVPSAGTIRAVAELSEDAIVVHAEQGVFRWPIASWEPRLLGRLF